MAGTSGVLKVTGDSNVRPSVRPMEKSFIVQIFLDMPGIVVCYQLQALQGCYQGLIHTSPKPNINNKMIGHDYWVLTVSWHCFKYFTWINSFTSLSIPMRQRYFYFHFRDGNTEVGKRGSNLLRVTQQLRSGAQISLAGQAAPEQYKSALRVRAGCPAHDWASGPWSR